MTKSDSIDAPPTTLPESWNYKQGGSQSSTEGGVSPPPQQPLSVGTEGDTKEDYHMMEQLKISNNEGRKKQQRDSVPSDNVHQPSNPPQHVVNELHARIQHLEAELEVTRRMPDRREVHVEGVMPHYQPNYYGNSPHHSGELMRGSNFSGPLPPHQYPQPQSTSLPVETGFYHPREY